MKQWLERHAQTLVGSLGRLWQHPFATLLTVIVIGIALALPACLHVLVQNVRAASGGWNNALDISVYMKPDATLDAGEARGGAHPPATRRRRGHGDRGRRGARGVPRAIRASATRSTRSRTTRCRTRSSCGPTPSTATRRTSQALTTELRKVDGVDIVQLDTEWVSRFNAILDVIRRGVFLAAGLFALGILVIVGNTIRLDIENRRDEIEVTKLVGGSDAFVRRPFLYNGVWYGLGGGARRRR